MTIAIVRTTFEDPHFRALIVRLDAELLQIYGDVQADYSPWNGVAGIATVVVALDGERPVGCGCFKRYSDTEVELKRVYVTDDARGQRVGTRVIDALEAWARELGYARMILETGPKQAAAIALYQRAGYAVIEPFGPYVNLTAASICMARELTA